MTEIEPRGTAIIARPATQELVAYADADYSVSAETVARLLRAKPPNTRRAYDRNWGQFERWCASEGRVALPATAQTLADYVVRLFGISLSPATVSQVIGTIRSRHADYGHRRQPDTRRTLELLRGYRREWADAGGRVRKATPVLVGALRAMAQTCDPQTAAGARDRSLLLTGFNGMCRRSELAALNLADVAEVADEGMTVFIRLSKTDKDSKGAEVGIPFGQHPATCAVRATRAWVDLMSERGIAGPALYRPVDRHDRISGEPMASGHAAQRLTGAAISAMVRRRAKLAGLADPEGYSGHSLRAGAATSAYQAGVPVSEIAKHGRWIENSPVVLGYIRAVDGWDDNPMKELGL